MIKEDVRQVYSFQKLLGTGAFGSVFLAKNKMVLSKEVAIKVLDRSSFVSGIDKLRNELEIMGEVDSPYLIKTKGIFYDEDYICIVMENVVGGELAEKIKKAPKGYMEEDEVKKHI